MLYHIKKYKDELYTYIEQLFQEKNDDVGLLGNSCAHSSTICWLRTMVRFFSFVKLGVHFVSVCLKVQKWTQTDI